MNWLYQIFLFRLCAGEENTVFHYVTYNSFHGIIMSPFVSGSIGKLHQEILENFSKASSKIRRHFLNNVSCENIFVYTKTTLL